MGKPFNSELLKLRDTVCWADRQEIDLLKKFLFEQNPTTPLVCVGSGGSTSACSYASLLYRMKCGTLSTAATPLELMYSGARMMQCCKLLFLSASGKNKDILTSIKYGIKYNESGMMAMCMKKESPTSKLVANNSNVMYWGVDIPSDKDGFLATNSLVAFFSLLSRCYDGEDVENYIDFNGGYQGNVNLCEIDSFVVLYGAFGEPVARDIESKLSEAALGTVMLADYRNFGHGRHHWFSKRGEHSAIVALVSPREKDLAKKTIGCLPNNISIIWISTDIDSPKASVDLLIRSFRFVSDLGIARGIDPGKPGVPPFGRSLYNLNYYRLSNAILPKESILDVAIRRKCGAVCADNHALHDYYCEACRTFVQNLCKTRFDAVAFDYDGTLSGADFDSRFSDHLNEKIRKELLKILEHGVKLIVATGRGDSASEVFAKDIPEQYWHLITFAYYNGQVEEVLKREPDMSSMENKLDDGLKLFVSELQKRLPEKKINYKLKQRKNMLSISSSFNEFVYSACNEIIWDLKLEGLKVWRSSHSMDIVVFRQVSKRNIIDNFSGNVLCIGDYGEVDGNDYEMLSTAFSLSVDKTSVNPNTCWNIAESGLIGVEATLYYLRHFKLGNGTFTCDFMI